MRNLPASLQRIKEMIVLLIIGHDILHKLTCTKIDLHLYIFIAFGTPSDNLLNLELKSPFALFYTEKFNKHDEKRTCFLFL